MKNNTLVGYITDNHDVIVDNFDQDHDCVGYDCKNHTYIIGSVLNVQGQPSSKILAAFKAGIKNMNDFKEASAPEIIMQGRHIMADGYMYDRSPLNIKSLQYITVIQELGYREIRLHYDDESKATYSYNLALVDEYNNDIKALIECGIDIRIITS